MSATKICPKCGKRKAKATDSDDKPARIRLTDSAVTKIAGAESRNARDRYIARTTSQYMDSAARDAHERLTLSRIHDANMNPRVLKIAATLARDHTTPGRDAYLARHEVAYRRR